MIKRRWVNLQILLTVLSVSVLACKEPDMPAPVTPPLEEELVQEESADPMADWCSDKGPDVPVPDWMRKDTLIIAWTDTMVGKVQFDNTKGSRRYVVFTDTFGPADSIEYVVKDGKLWGIIARYSPPAQELIIEYYFHDGDLRYIRHREWNKRPENYGALEFGFFFEKGELYYVRDRYVTDLEIWEPPARLACKKLRPSHIPREQLESEYKKFITGVMDKVKADMTARGLAK